MVKRGALDGNSFQLVKPQAVVSAPTEFRRGKTFHKMLEAAGVSFLPQLVNVKGHRIAGKGIGEPAKFILLALVYLKEALMGVGPVLVPGEYGAGSRTLVKHLLKARPTQLILMTFKIKLSSRFEYTISLFQGAKCVWHINQSGVAKAKVHAFVVNGQFCEVTLSQFGTEAWTVRKWIEVHTYGADAGSEMSDFVNRDSPATTKIKYGERRFVFLV